MTFNKTICAVALASLTACGGGGDSTGSGAPNGQSGSGAITVGEFRSFAEPFFGDFSSFDPQNVSTATPTGSATYQGFMQVEETLTEGLLGRVTLNADFVGSSVSGQASNFLYINDTTPQNATDAAQTDFTTLDTLSGSLGINGGTINTIMVGSDTSKILNGATMAGDLTGNRGTYSLDTTLAGAFGRVDGRDIVAGDVTGTTQWPGAGTASVDGTFIAVK